MFSLIGRGSRFVWSRHHATFFSFHHISYTLIQCVQAMREIINDKRYGALKTLGERKQAFHEVSI